MNLEVFHIMNNNMVYRGNIIEVRMRWSKPAFVSILLFVVCVSVIKCSSANRVENNTGWLKNNFKRFGEKQRHETSERRPNLRGFKGRTNSLVLNSEAERLKLESGKRRLHSNPASVPPKEHDIGDGIKSQGTNNPFAKTPELNNPERQNVSRQTSLRSDILSRRVSKGEANLGEFSNARKRIYKKMLQSSHRIAKRNVNMNEPTQPIVTPTPNPPVPSLKCSGQKSCSGRCTGTITVWRSDESLACYCDTACYEIFNDCCSDYTKYCGVQKPSDIWIKKLNWTCEPFGHFSSNQHCEVGEGLWMVSRCADDWPYDEIRSSCENATKFLRQASDIKRYIPVVSMDWTFRNYFCAKCNNVYIGWDFEYFPVEIKANVIPPSFYNLNKKINFLLSNGAEFRLSKPKNSQKRRYCLKSIVDFCPGKNTTTESCTNGPVELVSGPKPFKNYNCALCNDPRGLYTCFPSLLPSDCLFTPPQKFLLNLDNKDIYAVEELSVFSVLNTSCSCQGLIFDDKLQECVQHLIPPPYENEDRIRMLAWFAPSKDFQFTENDFKTVMKLYFGVEDSNIYNVSIDTVPRIFRSDPSFSSTILFHLVSSTLLLTPEQSFDILFKTDSNSFSLNLGNFIHFEKPLSVTLNNITYTIIKTTSRPFACITQKVYTPQEYNVFLEQIYNKRTYEKITEYYGEINGNITICEEYYPRYCETTQTGLNKNGFVINTNLSLYQKDTGMQYILGHYDVFNNSIALCNLEKLDIPKCKYQSSSCEDYCSNHTEWRTDIEMHCSCDPDCYEVFNDCCSDYTRYCGAQKPTETPTKKYNYSCEDAGLYNTESSTVADGLWMVTQCRPEWPYDTSRTKCEAPVDKFNMSSPDLYVYLPVLGHDNTTFRNMFCAICNGVERYEPWPLDIPTNITPPENYNITEKIRFLLFHGAKFPGGRGPWRPGANQARRHCLKEIIGSCPLGEKLESCTDGDVALIAVKKSVIANGYSYFKNTHCAACHGLPSETFSCFPDKYLSPSGNRLETAVVLVLHQSVQEVLESRTVESRKPASVMHVEPCGKSGKILHDSSQSCQINWSPSTERFYVYALLEPPQNSQNNSFTPTEFQKSLANYLNISQRQLFDVNITTVLQSETTTLFFYLVSSTITLTSQQSSELLLTNRSGNTSSSETKLVNYIYFSEPFILQIKGLPYTVTKTTPRPLACVEETTYTPEEYTLQDQERVFIPSTNKTYEKFEYYWENVEKHDVKQGNITVCEKYIPTKCNGSVVQYTTDEYSIMVNLSIYVQKTSSLYDYGEYEVLSNESVAICQYFKVRIITETRQTIRNNEALGYITFISFILSILFLIFLLVTYILFPQLRTLPGKNLMNFASSLLLFQIFWLPSNFTEVRSDKPTCMAMAITDHYFLIASFVSMSVIAFHTCRVFARRLPAPKVSHGRERKLFCTYLALVWLLPGIFVGICAVLDHQNVLKIGYGESEICWLTEKNAYTYFVTIPIAVLLLFNIIAFVIAAVYLRKHGRNKAARQASGNRRSNLSIYAKLSTLMGFTWVFGFLALVVTSTTVFWYFFVIITSLQGVFVTVAFVVNAKTFGLYKQRYASGSNTPQVNRMRRNIPTNI